MNDLFAIQQKKNLSFHEKNSQALDNSALKTLKKSKGPAKAKKITPNTQAQITNNDKTPPNKTLKILPEKTSPSKAPKLQNVPKKPPKPDSQAKTLKKPNSKTAELKETESSNKSFIKPSLKKIIKSSLKKEKVQKVLKEKEKKAQQEKKQLKKLDLEKQNLLIRLENTKWKKSKPNFKQIIGVESILNGQRSNGRSSSRKAKSTERVRGNLEQVRDWMDQKTFRHRRTLSHGSEKGELKTKCQKKNKLMDYIRNKTEMTQQQETDFKSRKIDKFELLRKAMRTRHKLRKVKKLKKLKNTSRIGRRKEHETSRVIESSDSSSGKRKSRNSSQKTCEICTDRSGSLNFKSVLEKKTNAAIKIQSHIRKFLVKCRVNKLKTQNSLTERSSQKTPRILTPVLNDIHDQSKEIEAKESILAMRAKLETLHYLKEKEIEDMKKITSKMNNEVGNILSEIIANRYSQLSSLLELGIKEVKENLLPDCQTSPKDSLPAGFQSKLEEISSLVLYEPEFIESLSEKIAPKSVQLNDSSLPIDTPQFSVILSPESSKNKSVKDPQENTENFSYFCQDSQNESFQNLNQNSLLVPDSLPEDRKPFFFKSDSPEFFPERPSAPLNFTDTSSPEVSPFMKEEESSESVSYSPIEVSPELVVDLAERIILEIIEEHEIFNRTDFEGFKIRTDSESVLSYSEGIYKFCDVVEVFDTVRLPAEKSRLNVMQYIKDNSFDMMKCATEMLHLNVYLMIEYQIDQARQPDRPIYISEEAQSWLIEAEHIHNKMVFDANNEALCKIRPSNLETLPIPFKVLKLRIVEDEKILQNVLDYLDNWSRFRIGKILTNDILNGNEMLDANLFNQIREDCLAKLLVQEINEDDPAWLSFEFEEIQTKLDLADDILQHLSQELVFILNLI